MTINNGKEQCVLKTYTYRHALINSIELAKENAKDKFSNIIFKEDKIFATLNNAVAIYDFRGNQLSLSEPLYPPFIDKVFPTKDGYYILAANKRYRIFKLYNYDNNGKLVNSATLPTNGYRNNFESIRITDSLLHFCYLSLDAMVSKPGYEVLTFSTKENKTISIWNSYQTLPELKANVRNNFIIEQNSNDLYFFYKTNKELHKFSFIKNQFKKAYRSTLDFEKVFEPNKNFAGKREDLPRKLKYKKIEPVKVHIEKDEIHILFKSLNELSNDFFESKTMNKSGFLHICLDKKTGEELYENFLPLTRNTNTLTNYSSEFVFKIINNQPYFYVLEKHEDKFNLISFKSTKNEIDQNINTIVLNKPNLASSNKNITNSKDRNSAKVGLRYSLFSAGKDKVIIGYYQENESEMKMYTIDIVKNEILNKK